jgi:hypothetical protein
MTIQFVLAPLFVQVLLTFMLLFGMAFARRRAFIDRKVSWKDAKRSRFAPWPPQATQFADSFSNQFEVPVLYYVLTLIVLFTRQADLLFVLLSWVFVVLRAGQAYVHVTSNYVPHRGGIYAASALVLLVMWIAFALRIYLL